MAVMVGGSSWSMDIARSLWTAACTFTVLEMDGGKGIVDGGGDRAGGAWSQDLCITNECYSDVLGYDARISGDFETCAISRICAIMQMHGNNSCLKAT